MNQRLSRQGNAYLAAGPSVLYVYSHHSHAALIHMMDGNIITLCRRALSWLPYVKSL